MGQRELIDLLADCENKFSQEDFDISGINMWPVIKLSIGSQLAHPKSGVPFGPSKRERVFNRLLGKSEFNRAIHLLKKPSDVLFISTSKFWEPLNGQLVDRYSYPFTKFLAELNYKCSIAHIRSPIKPPANSYVQEIPLARAMHWASAKWWLSTKPQLPGRTHDLMKHLEGHNIELKPIEDMVQSTLFYSNFFLEILQNATVHSIFYVCFYAPHNLGLAISAKKLGIRTIDIQHGVQGRFSVPYSYWNIPKNGLEVLPDYFWCWSNSEVDHISSWPGNDKHLGVNGGELWTAQFSEKTDPFDSHPSEDKPVILITLQPVEPSIPDFLVGAIKRSSGIIWWIRQHPLHLIEDDDFENRLKQLGIHQKVDFIDPTHDPLPKVLSRINLHATLWSSVVLDALRYGIPSITLHQIGHDLYSQEIELGKVHKCENPDNFLNQCMDLLNNKTRATSPISNDVIGKLLEIFPND